MFNKELLGTAGTPGPKELKFQREATESAPGLEGMEAMQIAPEETQQLIAAMMVNGMAVLDIAEKVKIPVNSIAKLRETADFRAILMAEANAKGPRVVQKMLVGALPELIVNLLQLATSTTLPGKARADICFGLMDRGMGKPVMGKALDSNITNEVATDPIAEDEQLSIKIETLQAKLFMCKPKDSNEDETLVNPKA